MNKRNIIYSLMGLVILIILLYSFGAFDGGEAYTESIRKFREEKHTFMKRSGESPLSLEQKKSFDSLNYYPPNPEYKVNARLTLFQNKNIINIPTSDNQLKSYIKYAFAEFEINDTTQRVLLLKAVDSDGPNDLFFAFSDETSGKETYGGGRYIDITSSSDRRVIIDFNKAYNPFCVFNENYSCPFPPKENQLTVAIRAGEKNYDY